MTRLSGLAEGAAALCEVKLGDGLVSLFFLGVLCNIFIYIAVEGYKSCPHELGKYLVLFFGVMGFILAGTEHCVADMFYFWLLRALERPGRAESAHYHPRQQRRRPPRPHPPSLRPAADMKKGRETLSFPAFCRFFSFRDSA